MSLRMDEFVFLLSKLFNRKRLREFNWKECLAP